MDDYTQLLRKAGHLVTVNRTNPCLNGPWLASHMQTDLALLDHALYKSSGRSCEEFIEHHRLSCFCKLVKQDPKRRIEEIAAECGLYSLCKLRESFYEHLGIHLEAFIVMNRTALEDLEIRRQNGDRALVFKEV